MFPRGWHSSLIYPCPITSINIFEVTLFVRSCAVKKKKKLKKCSKCVAPYVRTYRIRKKELNKSFKTNQGTRNKENKDIKREIKESEERKSDRIEYINEVSCRRTSTPEEKRKKESNRK